MTAQILPPYPAPAQQELAANALVPVTGSGDLLAQNEAVNGGTLDPAVGGDVIDEARKVREQMDRLLGRSATTSVMGAQASNETKVEKTPAAPHLSLVSNTPDSPTASPRTSPVARSDKPLRANTGSEPRPTNDSTPQEAKTSRAPLGPDNGFVVPGEYVAGISDATARVARHFKIKRLPLPTDVAPLPPRIATDAPVKAPVPKTNLSNVDPITGLTHKELRKLNPEERQAAATKHWAELRDGNVTDISTELYTRAQAVIKRRVESAEYSLSPDGMEDARMSAQMRKDSFNRRNKNLLAQQEKSDQIDAEMKKYFAELPEKVAAEIEAASGATAASEALVTALNDVNRTRKAYSKDLARREVSTLTNGSTLDRAPGYSVPKVVKMQNQNPSRLTTVMRRFGINRIVAQEDPKALNTQFEYEVAVGVAIELTRQRIIDANPELSDDELVQLGNEAVIEFALTGPTDRHGRKQNGELLKLMLDQKERRKVATGHYQTNHEGAVAQEIDLRHGRERYGVVAKDMVRAAGLNLSRRWDRVSQTNTGKKLKVGVEAVAGAAGYLSGSLGTTAMLVTSGATLVATATGILKQTRNQSVQVVREEKEKRVYAQSGEEVIVKKKITVADAEADALIIGYRAWVTELAEYRRDNDRVYDFEIQDFRNGLLDDYTDKARERAAQNKRAFNIGMVSVAGALAAGMVTNTGLRQF